MTAPTSTEHLMGGYHPRTWEEFVGQEPAKRELRLRARAAKRRGEPMPHCLFASGVQGIGKTSLALLTAAEIGGELVSLGGDLKANQVPFLFSGLRTGQVLFIDEFHRMVTGGSGKHNVEWMLPYLEQGVLPEEMRIPPEETPQITIIAATTDIGLLPAPIVDRFTICPTLTRYTEDQGAVIALGLARRILVEERQLACPTDEVAAAMARAGSNSPRLIRRLTLALADLVSEGEVPENGGKYDLSLAMEWAGVTEDGLTSQAQKYLLVIYTEYRHLPVGRNVMAQILREAGSGIDRIEDDLRTRGFIQLTGQGRKLTPDGMKRARLLAAS